ncbi:hypothetical protein GCM10010282_46890 [Streptomyces roseolus]|nr:hypothetical protein GCM10010282_46890 [Streptomyces roseolus]
MASLAATACYAPLAPPDTTAPGTPERSRTAYALPQEHEPARAPTGPPRTPTVTNRHDPMTGRPRLRHTEAAKPPPSFPIWLPLWQAVTATRGIAGGEDQHHVRQHDTHTG